MSRLIDFLFAAYAPLAARFHLIENTHATRSADAAAAEAKTPASATVAQHPSALRRPARRPSTLAA